MTNALWIEVVNMVATVVTAAGAVFGVYAYIAKPVHEFNSLIHKVYRDVCGYYANVTTQYSTEELVDEVRPVIRGYSIDVRNLLHKTPRYLRWYLVMNEREVYNLSGWLMEMSNTIGSMPRRELRADLAGNYKQVKDLLEAKLKIGKRV